MAVDASVVVALTLANEMIGVMGVVARRAVDVCGEGDAAVSGDLPVRLGELGTVYRYERSGVMHGLMRVRGFTQDDAHIFCTPEQIEDEVVNCLQFAVDTLTHVRLRRLRGRAFHLGQRRERQVRRHARAMEAGRGRADAAPRERLNLKVKVMPDEAAFYGPKIDVKLVDAIGRLWQLSTVQFDFTLPRRFGLEYIAEDGKKHQPLMVHRALFGSVERFFGILIEHYAGAFPVWLAPVQAIVLPITDRQLEYAGRCATGWSPPVFAPQWTSAARRSISRFATPSCRRVPYMLVVGDREQQSGQVAVRNRKHGDQGVRPSRNFWSTSSKLIAAKTPSE